MIYCLTTMMKRSCSVLVLLLSTVLKFDCLALMSSAQGPVDLYTMQGLEGKEGNGSGSEKLSHIPSVN